MFMTEREIVQANYNRIMQSYHNEQQIFDNKREEIIFCCERIVKQIVERIKRGTVIKDVVDDSGERTIVTVLENGNFGYQVFQVGDTEPHYYAEGSVLIDDLNKYTDSDGRGLRYLSAKSRVQRNLTGTFLEYILDPGFHSFYISQKFTDKDEVRISQRMAGYEKQDAVSIFSCQFDRKEISVVADAQTFKDGDKYNIRVGLGKVRDDGTIDYDLQMKMLLEAELAKKFLGESHMTKERLNKVIKKANMDAQALYYGLYDTLNFPILEGVVPNDLLIRQSLSYITITDDNSNNRSLK